MPTYYWLLELLGLLLAWVQFDIALTASRLYLESGTSEQEIAGKVLSLLEGLDQSLVLIGIPPIVRDAHEGISAFLWELIGD